MIKMIKFLFWIKTYKFVALCKYCMFDPHKYSKTKTEPAAADANLAAPVADFVYSDALTYYD